MYNADLQCRLQFNTTDELVRVCSKSDEICSQLWCMVNDICVTQMRPAAPGTHCGKHKVRRTIGWRLTSERLTVKFYYHSSGAKIKNASQSKSNLIRSMVAGVTGINGLFVHANVAAAYRCNSVNVIIQHPNMAEHFVLANGFDIKRVMLMHVPRMSPVFEHNNAPALIMKHSVGNNTIGCHISIAVSN